MKIRIYANSDLPVEELDEQVEMLLRSRGNLEVTGYESAEGFCITAEDKEFRKSTLVVYLTKIRDAVMLMIGYDPHRSTVLPADSREPEDALIRSVLSFTDAYHRQLAFE